MDIEELSKKIDKYHRENKKREQRRAEKVRYENLNYIALGFALAVSGFAATATCCVKTGVFSVVAIVLYLISVMAFRKARKIKIQ